MNAQTQYTLSDVLEAFWLHKLAELNTAIPCKVITVYPDMRVDLQPMINRLYQDGSTALRPVVLNCCLWMPGSATGLVHIPVNKGDIVLGIFSQRGLDAFKTGVGGFDDPLDYRVFDKHDAIALPGLFPFALAPTLKRTLPFDPNELSLTNNIGVAGKETVVALQATGDVLIKTSTNINVQANAATVTAPTINMIGNVGVTGNVAITGTLNCTGTGTFAAPITAPDYISPIGSYVVHYHNVTAVGAPSGPPIG